MPDPRFVLDAESCIGCGRCVNVCPGAVLELDADRHPHVVEFEEYGWNGCWRCEHCLAVCPKAAISVFGKTADESIPAPSPEETGPMVEALVVNRHSCRRYSRRPVPKELIARMVDLVACAPNGGNKQQVEFCVADDMEVAAKFHDLAYERMDQLMEQDVFPEGWDRASFEDLKRWEKTVRPDMLLSGAPYFIIPHAPLGKGEPIPDVMIAATYLEVLCAGYGLGCNIMTFPLDVLSTMPDILALLGIPEDHYVGCVVGFGWPQIPYQRGTQRHVEPERITHLSL